MRPLSSPAVDTLRRRRQFPGRRGAPLGTASDMPLSRSSVDVGQWC